MWWLAVASMATSLIGGAKQAKAHTKSAWSSMETGAYNDAQKAVESDQIREAADLKAKQIKSSALFMRGKQIANQAASGVVVGDGSAQAMVEQTIALSSQDVFVELYNGAASSLYAMNAGKNYGIAAMAQSDAQDSAADSAIFQGVTSAAQTGISAYYSGK